MEQAIGWNPGCDVIADAAAVDFGIPEMQHARNSRDGRRRHDSIEGDIACNTFLRWVAIASVLKRPLSDESNAKEQHAVHAQVFLRCMTNERHLLERSRSTVDLRTRNIRSAAKRITKLNS